MYAVLANQVSVPRGTIDIVSDLFGTLCFSNQRSSPRRTRSRIAPMRRRASDLSVAA
jgi:hypothetical protein